MNLRKRVDVSRGEIFAFTSELIRGVQTTHSAEEARFWYGLIVVSKALGGVEFQMLGLRTGTAHRIEHSH